VEIVCNSTPLIHLSRIGHLWILEKLFGRLTIPTEVYNEIVLKGEAKPGSRDVVEAAWISIREVKNVYAVQELNSVLHLGESEAIVLAEEIEADLIILDDNRARKVAAMRGLSVVGTLALLRQAMEKELIPALKPLFDDLRSMGFYMGKEYDEILKDAGEL
jgi:predicted nucleic acid-binding protein